MSTDISLYRSYDSVVCSNRDIVKETIVALRAIRDSKLYLVEFATYEDYVSDRFGRSVRWAQRLLLDDEKTQESPQNVRQDVANSAQINTESEPAEEESEPIESVRGEITDDNPNSDEIDHEETSRPQDETTFESADELDAKDECVDHLRDAVDYPDARKFGKQQIVDACYAAANYAKRLK